MKRSIYIVKSYDGKINKRYRNYISAYKFALKLVSNDIDCGIFTYNNSQDLILIIGC